MSCFLAEIALLLAEIARLHPCACFLNHGSIFRSFLIAERIEELERSLKEQKDIVSEQRSDLETQHHVQKVQQKENDELRLKLDQTKKQMTTQLQSLTTQLQQEQQLQVKVSQKSSIYLLVVKLTLFIVVCLSLVRSEFDTAWDSDWEVRSIRRLTLLSSHFFKSHMLRLFLLCHVVLAGIWRLHPAECCPCSTHRDLNLFHSIVLCGGYLAERGGCVRFVEMPKRVLVLSCQW